MNYCSNCGGPVARRVPPNDDRPRFVCDRCGTIHYQNPKMVAGAIVEVEDDILLCRRAIEPRRGLWTLPAGYMENSETVADCARRETREEAGALLGDLHPYALLNLPFVNQIYFIYRAPLLGSFEAGAESLEVKLFGIAEIPWESLAFAVIREVLEVYVADRGNGSFPFRVLDVARVHH